MKNNSMWLIVLYLILGVSSKSFAMDQVVLWEFDQTIAYDSGVFKQHEDTTTASFSAQRPQGILRQQEGPALVFAHHLLGEDVDHVQGPVIRAKLLVPGEDRRTRISNTLEWPYSVCVQLTMVRNGQTYGGSGTMVGPQHVLTAAHNLVNGGNWKDEVFVYPALNCQHEPFGEIKVVKAYTFSEWVNGNDEKFDMALLVLNKPIGYFTGWAGIQSTTNELLLLKQYGSNFSVRMAESAVVVTGYPGDKGCDEMWAMSNKLKKINPETFEYDIDTTPGQSGSPIWVVEGNGDPIVLGVHTMGGSRVNYGVRVSMHKYRSLILKAIGDTYTPRVVPLSAHNNGANQNFIYLDYDTTIRPFEEWMKELRNRNEPWAKKVYEQVSKQRSLILDNSRFVESPTERCVKKLAIPGHVLGQDGALYLVSTCFDVLKELHLSHSPVNNNNTSKPPVKSFSEIRSQKEKNVSVAKNSPEMDDAVMEILASSACFPAVGTLNLDYTKIKIGALRALAQGKFYALQKVSLNDCNLGDDEVIELANGNFCAMLALCLSNNNIGDRGTISLTNGCFNTLEELNLQHNNIGNDGAASFATGNLTGLVKLILSHNNVGSDGFIELVKGELYALIELNVRNNNLEDGVIGALENWNLLGLSDLSLQNNPISEVAFQELRTALPDTKIHSSAPKKEPTVSAKNGKQATVSVKSGKQAKGHKRC